jgi:arabinofuranan 3-O-arabinosyltransferase
MGHLGSPEGFFAPEVQGWLDQALAPLRNTHKFDVVVRLPLVLGLAHVLSAVAARRRDRPGRTLFAWGVAVLACSALLGSTVPAWTGSLPSRGHFDEVPVYWSQTAEWLGDHDDGRRALLLPGSPFGSYLWGEPRDEPMQPLATSPWAVRNAIPLAPGGNIEALDAIEARLAAGVGSAGLAPSLRRMGIGFLVVRNDLTRAAARRIRSSCTRRSCRHPASSSSRASDRLSVGRPFSASRRQGVRQRRMAGPPTAVEIYRVAGAGDAVRMQAWNQVPTVVGGPESLIALDELGELAGESVIMAEDVPEPGPPGPVVLTDGRRRQEVAFGRIVDNRSASLGEGDPYVLSRPVHQYADQAVEQWLTAPGCSVPSASSRRHRCRTRTPPDPSSKPPSRGRPFDGDPLTAWVSGPATLVDGRVSRPWIQVDLEDPDAGHTCRAASRRAGAHGARGGRQHGPGIRRRASAPGETTTVTLPEGLTSSIRIDAGRTGPASLSLAEVDLGETAAPSRPLVLPATPAAWGVRTACSSTPTTVTAQAVSW